MIIRTAGSTFRKTADLRRFQWIAAAVPQQKEQTADSGAGSLPLLTSAGQENLTGKWFFRWFLGFLRQLGVLTLNT
jgi:hypothetical protein